METKLKQAHNFFTQSKDIKVRKSLNSDEINKEIEKERNREFLKNNR